MKRYETANIRNVCLVGHGGTGKTSLGEAMLFTAKATTRLGSVDSETSTFDFEPEEIRRKTSHASAVASVEWKQNKINIVDTPGDTVFHADTRLAIMSTDLTVLLISGVDQVEVGAVQCWKSLEEIKRPRLIYIAKMDKERADFNKTMTALRDSWGPNIAPLQIPIGHQENFKGVVDLLNMKAYTYSMDGTGTASIGDVPDDLADAAMEAREQLIEAVASADDELIEKYLETGELSEAEVIAGLKTAVASGELIPVVCGSGTGNSGTDVLMDAIVNIGPNPADATPPQAHDADGQAVAISCNANGPLAALVFKTVYLEMGKVCFIRVFQGKGDADQSFYNVTRSGKERWGQVMLPAGKKLEALPGADCGDIFAVAKLKDARVGDALCAERDHIEVIAPSVPNACISYALKSKKKGDEDKMANALSRILDCDIALTTSRDPETKDHLISGTGQTHIEIAVEKMRRFGGDAELALPRVPYRECIRGKATKVEGKHKKQSGGRGQYGVCYLDMEPAARGDGFVFDNKIFGGSIPSQFVPAVEKGIKEAMTKGVIAGYQVVDVTVRLVDGKYHPVDSDGRSFEMAGRLGFREAFKQCSPTLLEPIMNLEVRVPDDCMGDTMGDINARRGRVQGMDAEGIVQVIKAQVPQAEVLTYAPDLRSITAGRGSFSISFSHYDEVPGNLVDKIVEAHQAELEED